MSGEKFVRKSDGTIVFQAHKDNEAYGEWLMKNNKPEAPTNLTPYGWGIVDKDGNAAADFCDGDEKYVQEEADSMNRSIEKYYKVGAPYRVVQLFYKDES